MFASQPQQEDEETQADFLGFCAFCVELVGGSSQKQNWKGLGIAFIVIAIICGFIAAAIFLTTTKPAINQAKSVPFNQSDIYNIEAPKPWNGTWISDRYFSYFDTNDSIWIYDCDRVKGELLLRRDLVPQEAIVHGIISPSAKYILVASQKGKIRPYYTEYKYDLYEGKRLIASINIDDNEKIAVSAVVYSHSDHLFAFIYDFDIYIYDIIDRKSSRVTFDGNRNKIHNGLVEWIYEYETFNGRTLVYWSPTDYYLAFIKINLTNVSENHYLNYDLYENSDQYSIPYPKYNETLPFIDVYIFNIKSKKIIRVPKRIETRTFKRNGLYIYHFVWCNDTHFSIVYGNRYLNSSIIQIYEINDSKIYLKAKFMEETTKGYLLSRYLKPHFSFNGLYAHIIRFDSNNIDRSSQKSFARVVRIDFTQGYPQIDARSPRGINVDEIVHVDYFGDVYFTGFTENDSLERQLYRWNSSNEITQIECLSCNDSCSYANAQFSLGKGNYFILECYGPLIPYSFLYNRNERIASINNNDVFREWMQDREMPFIDYFSVPLDDKKTVFGNGMIILPPNYDPNRTIASYPVLITMNDRLHDQRVTKKYILPLAEFILVIENNISIVIFDAHGSRGQDENYLKHNFENWLERQYTDYVKLAQHLKWNEAKFNETLNNTRFGLKARGPAALVALKLLQQTDKKPSEYVCALLQSPVTILSQYYATYTEYLNDVKIDMDFIDQSNFQNKSLAIVHGTSDENAHFKHSATLVKSFISKHIRHDFKVYPDVSHYLEQDQTVYNDFLKYQRRFFHDCLGSRTNKERKSTVSEESD